GESYTIDKTAPTVSSIVRADPNPTSAASVDFTVTLSEAVSGVAAGNFTVTMGGSVAGATVSGVSGAGDTWTVTVDTGTGDGTIRLDATAAGAVVDTTGNPLTGLPFTTGESYTIDKTGPTVSVTPDGTSTNSSPITFTITFSESVTGLTAAEISITNGTPGALSGSGTTYAIPVTPTADGAIALQVPVAAAQDDAANATSPSNVASVTYDSTPPTVTSITRASPDPTNAAFVDFTVTISEPVSNVDTADFSLTTTGAVSSPSVSGVSGSGTAYTITVDTGTGDGTLRLDLPPVVTIADAAGNPLSGPYTAGPAYTVDKSSDITPPLPGTVNDGSGLDLAYQTSPTTLTANWSGFSDPESGIAFYEWAIGTSPGAADIQPFVSTALATSASNPALTLIDGATYYVTVRATNSAALSAIATSNGVTVDSSPPIPGTVNDGPGPDIDWQNTPWQLGTNWSGFSDPHTGIASYEWAIGTSPGATDIQPFTPSPSPISAAAGSLSLSHATTYFVSIRAINPAGLSTVATSDGVTLDTVPPSSPLPLTPGSDIEISSLNTVYFDWSSVPDAVGYRFQLDDAPAFAAPYILDLITESSDFNSGTLPPGVYYWRVIAVDAAGNESTPSSTFSFTVVGSAVGSLTVELGPSSPPPSNELNTAQDLSIIQLRITASPHEHILISSLRLTAAGTADDALHIDNARLYDDSDNNGLLDPNFDTLLAGPLSFTVDDGSITFQDLAYILPADESRHWILVYSLAGNAPFGSTLAAAMLLPQDLTATGLTSDRPLLPSGAFPIVGNTMTIVPSGTPGHLSITRGAQMPTIGFIRAAEQTVEVMQFQVRASSIEAITATGLVVRASGSGDDADHIGNVFLARDLNGNGVFNAGTDPVLDASTYALDDGTASFSFSTLLPAGASERWIVVYDMNGAGPNGATFSARLEPATVGDVTAVGVSSGASIAPSGVTIGGAVKTIGSSGAVDGDLTVTNVPVLPSEPVPPYVHDLPMAAFELTAGGLENVVVQQLRITGTGTGNEAADVARASLWEDADADGLLSPGDRPLAVLASPFAADDGFATFALYEVIPASETRRWFIAYDLSGWGTAGRTFQTSFNLASMPSPVLASGASSNSLLICSGGVVVGPLVRLGRLVGSSGHKKSASCPAASSDRAPPAYLLLILLALATTLRRSSRRASGSRGSAESSAPRP
ncbi:MAG: hypothetical protein HYY16_07525, partial [Planctomycetes bacterium]|nr:hypothetical protein [Planctomycetota bacterium]